MERLTKELEPHRIIPGLQCRRHEKSDTSQDEVIPPAGDNDWQVTAEPVRGENPPRQQDNEWILTLRRKGGELENASVALTLDFENWDTGKYVLLPGAAYAGNRFESRQIPYPPILEDAAGLGQDAPPVITDIPRLNNKEGPSQIVQLTRDCTTPCIGVFDPESRTSFFLLCPVSTRFGDTGLEVEENLERTFASIRLRVPGVRPKTRASFCSTRREPSPDRGTAITTGLNITLRFQLHVRPCENLRAFYEQFFRLRNAFSGKRSFSHDLPFSASWRLLEDKYNRENWNEKGGYYHTGPYHLEETRLAPFDWQTGWVGGLQFSLAQLAMGTEVTRKRALRTIDFALTRLPAPSGLLWGGWSEGRPWGDHFHNTGLPWVMTRKNGDALYFLLKAFDLLSKRDPAWRPPKHWNKAVLDLAEAFVRIWRKNGQLGQFLDLETGEILVGGSCAAAVVPAALVLASTWFGREDFLQVAGDSASSMRFHYADRGYTNGGPGEILQCPDSESAFALLESFMVLYEATGNRHWVPEAEFLAHQCASWCVNHNFPFPPESEFGRLGIESCGSVWASVQNKHSAPGICTFSGDSLFKLYRATRDRRYLDLLQEIAHNITQYLSREDRPIRGFSITDVGNYATMQYMPPGWMSERVCLSDLSEPTGEVFAGSCWCESSCMLTAWEIPGLYVQPDTGMVVPFDHVTAEVLEKDSSGIRLRLTNPTRFPLRIRIMVEHEQCLNKLLGQNAMLAATCLELGPGESIHPQF